MNNYAYPGSKINWKEKEKSVSPGQDQQLSRMHIEKTRIPNLNGYTVYSSNYVAFSKGQHQQTEKEQWFPVGWEQKGLKRQSTQKFCVWYSKMDVGHCPFVKTPQNRQYQEHVI